MENCILRLRDSQSPESNLDSHPGPLLVGGTARFFEEDKEVAPKRATRDMAFHRRIICSLRMRTKSLRSDQNCSHSGQLPAKSGGPLTAARSVWRRVYVLHALFWSETASSFGELRQAV
jgi:hypothetical protein